MLTSPLNEVRDTFGLLLDFAQRVKAPLIPAPGSELFDDAQVFKPMPTSEVAAQSLGVAVDHLKGFRAWVHAADYTGLFPSATFSLLRGALIGGAVAAWVLHPDDSNDRVSRGLAVTAEWYRNYANYTRSVGPFAEDADEHRSVLELVEQRADEVRTLRQGRSPAGRLNMTEVIREVTLEVWPFDTERSLATTMIWQSGGGDAHAFGWPALARSTKRIPAGGGMIQVMNAPSLQEVADAYLCPFDLVAYGFSRVNDLSLVQ